MKGKRISGFHALCAALLLWTGCRSGEEATAPDWAYRSVVYEMNLRQQTPEGTFAAAEARLPFLKKIGVDLIWLMPIHPIGEEGRKGSLGSYYSIRDYRAVNPEFGTMADFDRFLKKAHELGFHVIMDFVANHTARDAAWIDEKPAEWYHRDSTGAPLVQYDWTDIAKLNYDCPEVWDEMTDVLKFWTEKGVDGFRCDVAGEIPDRFWSRAWKEVRALNPEVYLLAEGEGVHFHRHGFHATYSWELLHLMEEVARGTKGAKDLRKYIRRDLREYPADAFRLAFTSNHDENSWSGTEFERYGKAAEAMAALTYCLPLGQPLIYTGQEVGYDHRFLFFDKDAAPDWKMNRTSYVYIRLNRLRHDHPAVAPGARGGRPVWFRKLPEGTLAFTRKAGGDEVLALFNFSSLPKDIAFPASVSGGWQELLSGEKIELNPRSFFTLEPWGYRILTRKD